MKKLILKQYLVLLCIAFSASTFAANSQFYLTAKHAPLGASSSIGKGSKGIYLRWDVVEGNLPDDIVKLRLKRGNVVLVEQPVFNVMSIEQINSIYANSAEQQRLLHTIGLLKKFALSNNTDFNASEFAKELYQRLDPTFNVNIYDQVWVHLASRQNFNIARARYRAFLDTDFDTSVTSPITYTLEAINSANSAVQIGKVSVNLNQVEDTKLLPVTNFHQVEKQTCNIADSLSDHNTVILDWFGAGNNITDKAANSIQLAGYHLYRSSENISSNLDESNITPKDLASEALNSVHDQQGFAQFAGLEKANKLLILSEGAGVGANREPAYFESPEALMLDGLKPGDRRIYYIVPVDYAGHLGETSAIIVKVPDRIKPATPWNISFTQTMGDVPVGRLNWDTSNLYNYTAMYGSSRVICNAETAVVDGKVEFADDLESCSAPRYTRLAVDEYLIYRFNTFTEANQFSDADGDGYSDSYERGREWNECLADSSGIGMPKNYLLDSSVIEDVALASGRSIRRFTDPNITLPENTSIEFWYRIASKSADGEISYLSSPERAIFYDMELPETPTFTAIVRGDCCEITAVDAAATEWGFNDLVQLTNQMSLMFTGKPESLSPIVDMRSFTDSQSPVCSNTSPINDFFGIETKAGPRKLIYGDICTADVPESLNLCTSGTWQLEEKECDEPLIPGSTVDGDVYFTISVEEGDCIEVWDDIAGQLSRSSTTCGTDNPSTLIIQAELGICRHTVAIDPSGNTSAQQPLPCSVQAGTVAPNPPQVISLSLIDTKAEFSWRLPLEPVAVTLIELTSDVDSDLSVDTDSQIFTFPTAGYNPAMLLDHMTDIHSIIAAREEWCVRMKSIAPAPAGTSEALSSPWSNQLCTHRRENGIVSTEYLPWPKIDKKALSIGYPSISFGSDYADTSTGVNYEKMPIIMSFTSALINPIIDGAGCTFIRRTVNYADDPKELLFARSVSCNSLEAASDVEALLHSSIGKSFIVYRQGEHGGVRGPWVQVSPLIDKVHWDVVDTKAGDPTFSLWKFNDPYFTFIRRNYNEPTNWFFSYIDRYPYIAGYFYRYQFVSFNEDHEIEKVRQTSWRQTPELNQVQQGAN